MHAYVCYKGMFVVVPVGHHGKFPALVHHTLHCSKCTRTVVTWHLVIPIVDRVHCSQQGCALIEVAATPLLCSLPHNTSFQLVLYSSALVWVHPRATQWLSSEHVLYVC